MPLGIIQVYNINMIVYIYYIYIYTQAQYILYFKSSHQNDSNYIIYMKMQMYHCTH